MSSLDTLKAFDDLETSKISIWSNVFWYVKLCILWYSISMQKYVYSDILIFNTLYNWGETQLKKIKKNKNNSLRTT